MEPCDADFGFKDELRREIAERHDEFWVDGACLLTQERSAELDFFWAWIAVSRWPAFQDIRNEDLFACQACDFQQLVKVLPGFSHEGQALQILVLARCFTDEQDARVGVPISENRLGASRS
jgi:hypothetical protein